LTSESPVDFDNWQLILSHIILSQAIKPPKMMFVKAPEPSKALYTCCFCWRRLIMSRRASFSAVASALTSGNDSSSKTRCTRLVNSFCKACPLWQEKPYYYFTHGEILLGIAINSTIKFSQLQKYRYINIEQYILTA